MHRTRRAAGTGARFEVVPVGPLPGPAAPDLWGVADRNDGNRPIAGADSRPVVFHSFTDASRWADVQG